MKQALRMIFLSLFAVLLVTAATPTEAQAVAAAGAVEGRAAAQGRRGSHKKRHKAASRARGGKSAKHASHTPAPPSSGEL